MRLNALVPEFAVTDLAVSLGFYRDLLGFAVAYARPEDGFAFVTLGEAQLMLDQADRGRTFETDEAPREHPFGRGLNLQIRVDTARPLLAALERAGIAPYLPLEVKWYRQGGVETGNRQFVVADPDGYLLRFFEDLGERPAQVRPLGRSGTNGSLAVRKRHKPKS